MIQAIDLHHQVAGIDPQSLRHVDFDARGIVTDADDIVESRIIKRLGHQAGGIGKVEHRRIGLCHPADQLHILDHGGDGADGIGKPACACGLLPDDAQIQGRPLIHSPGRILAYPDRRDHIVRIGQRLHRVLSKNDLQAAIRAFAEIFGDAAKVAQLFPVVVHDRHLRNIHFPAEFHQRFNEIIGADTAAADQR